MTGGTASHAHLADGRRIYYIEEGDGPPLIYVHGATGNADVARPMFESLQDRFHCIALDRVGYLRSGALDRLTTVDEQVEAIAVVHDACSREPAWVFGHSAGGVFSLAYAVAHPDRVRGLVLMEPALLAVWPPDARPEMVRTQTDVVVALVREERLFEAISVFAMTLGIGDSPEACDEFARTALLPESRGAWEGWATENETVIGWAPTGAQWRGLTQPALVQEGDQTVGWLREVAALVSQKLPNGELDTLIGLDHLAPVEAPATVAGRAAAFIDRQS